MGWFKKGWLRLVPKLLFNVKKCPVNNTQVTKHGGITVSVLGSRSKGPEFESRSGRNSIAYAKFQIHVLLSVTRIDGYVVSNK